MQRLPRLTSSGKPRPARRVRRAEAGCYPAQFATIQHTLVAAYPVPATSGRDHRRPSVLGQMTDVPLTDREALRGLIALRDALGEQFRAGFFLNTGTEAYRIEERIYVCPADRLWRTNRA